MCIKRFFLCPLLDQYKAIAISDYRMDIILNAPLLSPDQRSEFFKSRELVRASTWLGIDDDDKPNFIRHR